MYIYHVSGQGQGGGVQLEQLELEETRPKDDLLPQRKEQEIGWLEGFRTKIPPIIIYTLDNRLEFITSSAAYEASQPGGYV